MNSILSRYRSKILTGIMIFMLCLSMIATDTAAISASSAASGGDGDGVRIEELHHASTSTVDASEVITATSSSSEKASGAGGGPGGSGGPGNGSQGGSAPGGADTQSYDYSGSYTGALTADGKTVTKKDTSITASDKDQNAVLAQNGGTLKLNRVRIKKSGSDEDGDNCNFYGVNSSALAAGSGSKLYIKNSGIYSTSTGSNGIFATDSARVYVNNTKITTTSGGNSRGLDATYGGRIYGNKLTVSTEGDHSAALATDRGGGYISVTNSTLKTRGSGSPLIYSTGDIEVDNVKGTASGSQIAGMEGKNRILIKNSTLTSTNDAISGSDPIKNGIILYQSTSGDADTSADEASVFEAYDSTLRTSITSGAMFYVTNTDAKVILQNTKLDFDSDDVYLVNASGNSSNNWGTSGSNGGTLSLLAKEETLSGDIYTDGISSVDLYLTKGSTWTGQTDGEANTSVTVAKGSKWVVTGDCTVSSLNLASGAKLVDESGKTVSVVANGKTVVNGKSSVTVTVSGTYSTTASVPSSAKSSGKSLSRSAFDEYFGTSTTMGENDGKKRGAVVE